MLNIYSIVEALTISFFYYRFFESRNFKVVSIVAGFLFLVVSVQQIVTLDKDILNHVSVTLESVMVTLFVVGVLSCSRISYPVAHPLPRKPLVEAFWEL